MTDWFRALWEAIRQTWSYILFGFGLGIVCALVSEKLGGPTKFGGKFLEHLSNGLFVSSIAVLFYEWGSHAKHALDLSTRLGELLRAKGQKAIADGMETMFVDWPELRERHGHFIEALRELNENKNRGREADMKFLTLFVEHGAKYGGQLRRVRQHLAAPDDDDERPFHLDFTKLDYADNILTHWMGFLGPGDSYVTLSNPRTWSALKRRKFQNAGGDAVTRGAHIQRIFVMDRKDDEHSPADIHNLIAHYQFAASRQQQERGRYEIQIATREVYAPRDIKPENQHYGVFTARFGFQESGKDVKPMSVAFKVMDGKVENFELVVVGPEGELVRNFKEIWESLQLSGDGPLINADGKPTATGPSRFLDAVMSREVNHLTRPGRPYVVEIVSTPASWSEPLRHSTPSLDKAIAGFEVRHLFVLDRSEQRRELADHLSVRATDPPWRVATVVASEVAERTRHWLVPHWRIMEGEGKDRRSLHDCIFTLSCKPDLSNFFVNPMDSPVRAADYSRNFDEVWKVASPVDNGNA